MQNLEKLTQKRLSHLNSCIENNDNSHSIISNLYSDSNHFIYELIQNAQDAGATTIHFELYADKIEISHNGKPFDFKDIEAITTIGNSTKLDEPNKIGKFGAGFKSVFSITNSPHIYSGEYSFKISNFIVPSSVVPDYQSTTDTLIVLPFDREDFDKNWLYKSISKRLLLISKDEIIFLNSIRQISWNIAGEAESVEKTVEIKSDLRTIVEIRKSNTVEYFELYTHKFSIDNKALECKIAFLLDDDNYKTISAKPLYVFFPTMAPTGVGFMLHAPYKTTPNRESINFDDVQNIEITNNIAILYEKTVIDMANREILDAYMLQLLVSVNQHTQISLKLIETAARIFKNQSIIQTHDNSYMSASEIFVMEKDLGLFLESNIKTLFDKKAYLHSSFNKPENIDAKRFLIHRVGIKEYSFLEILSSFDEQFLANQSDEWIIALYKECSDRYSRISAILSKVPLARLSDGSYIPFKSNDLKNQLYLYADIESDFVYLNPILSASNIAKPFFDLLELKTPDIVDEIRDSLLPKLKLSIDDSELDSYYENIHKLIKSYKKSDSINREKIATLLQENEWLLSSNCTLVNINSLYAPTIELKKWFTGNKSTIFIDEKLWSIIEKEELSTLPFQTRPKLEKISPHIDREQKDRLAHTNIEIDSGGDDFILDGLEALLSREVDIKLSAVIWDFIVSYLQDDKNILRGYFRWKNSSISHEKEFESKTLMLLKNSYWIFDTDEKSYKTTQIKTQNLNGIYKYSELPVQIRELLAQLSFKTDAIEQLEQQGYIVISSDEAKEYEEFKKLKLEKEAVSSEWKSEVKPNITANISSLKSTPRAPVDLKNQKPRLFYDDKTEQPKIMLSEEVRKQLGEWSEQFVYNYLLDFCKNRNGENYSIKELNSEDKVGWGYDFVLMKDDQEVRYIEVKGISSGSSEVEITKTQWSFAKYLYDNNEGYKYSIFIVKNAGKSSAEIVSINNPIEAWLKNTIAFLGIKIVVD